MLGRAQIKQLEHQAIVAALFRLCDPRGMENLKTGDTVRLKSGGPVITIGAAMSALIAIDAISGTTLQHGTFQLEQLEKAEPEHEPKDES